MYTVFQFQVDTLNYFHSKRMLIYDIRSTHIAVGNSKDTLNKIFFLDYSSSIQFSAEYRPKHDLILFGLVLLELNGVKFPQKIKGVEFDGIQNIVDSLLAKWDTDYANVRRIRIYTYTYTYYL